MNKGLIAENSISINAPASKVWNILINPEITRKYMFDCKAISDWKVGSSLIWKGASDGKIYVTGTILRIEPGKLLQYTTFDPHGGLEDVPSNYLTATYTLTDENGSTLLAVSQGDFSTAPDGQKRYEETAGGWAIVLPKVKELAEQGL